MYTCPQGRKVPPERCGPEDNEYADDEGVAFERVAAGEKFAVEEDACFCEAHGCNH